MQAQQTAAPVPKGQLSPGPQNPPPETDMLLWAKTAALSLAALAGLGGLFALYSARVVAMPVTAAIVVGLIVGPIGDRGRARNIPGSVVYALVILAMLATLYLTSLLLAPIVQEVIDAVPALVARFGALSVRVQGWLQSLQPFHIAQIPNEAPGQSPPTTAMEMAATAVSIVTPAVSQTVIFLFTLILFLAGRTEIRSSLVLWFGNHESRLWALRIFYRLENNLTDYFLLIGAVNAALGVIVACVFFVAGVPGAASWGMMAFVFNFLPVVGPLLMKAALLALGLATAPTVLEGLVPMLLYLAISLAEANLVTPRLVARRITANPLVVFLSIVLWTWLWGFAGAFLAMPMLAIIGTFRDALDEKGSPTLP